MNYRMPSYYKDFTCIANKCPDTCCAGWEIVIDEDTMSRYATLGGDLGKYVMSNVDKEEGIYKRCGNRCAFLNDDNLCDLIINAGEDKLCKTCDRYPRHFEEYGNLLEAAISISCPVAAKIIIDREETDSFKVKNDNKPALSKDVDESLLAGILEVRSLIFDILKDRKHNVSIRIKKILAIGEMVQPLVYDYEKLGYKKYIPFVKKKKLCQISSVLKEENWLDNSEKTKKYQADAEGKQKLICAYMEMFTSLENINDKWPAMIEEVIKALYIDISAEEYVRLREEFLAYMTHREYEYEHLLVYFIYAYLLGGVYDYNIQGMIKFSVVSTLVIQEMGFAHWIKHNKSFTIEDQVKYAYLYSRQVEHSSNNVLCLEGILTAHPQFSVEKIMSII